MHADRGFTLLEVLVALVIAGLALVLLTRVGLDGVRGATLSGRYQEALARAQSHLAAIGDRPQPGDNQGDEGDGFHWHVRIVPLANATVPGRRTLTAAAAPPTQVALLAVSVAISWGMPPRMVELDSERVAAAVATDTP